MAVRSIRYAVCEVVRVPTTVPATANSSVLSARRWVEQEIKYQELRVLRTEARAVRCRDYASVHGKEPQEELMCVLADDLGLPTAKILPSAMEPPPTPVRVADVAAELRAHGPRGVEGAGVMVGRFRVAESCS